MGVWGPVCVPRFNDKAHRVAGGGRASAGAPAGPHPHPPNQRAFTPTPGSSCQRRACKTICSSVQREQRWFLYFCGRRFGCFFLQEINSVQGQGGRGKRVRRKSHFASPLGPKARKQRWPKFTGDASRGGGPRGRGTQWLPAGERRAETPLGLVGSGRAFRGSRGNHRLPRTWFPPRWPNTETPELLSSH